METDKYIDYKPSDFVLDEDFRLWIKGEDEKSKAKLDKIIRDLPEKKQEIEQAKAILLSLNFNKKKISSQHIDLEWQKLKNGIEERNSGAIQQRKNNIYSISSKFKKVAAAIAIIAIFTFIANFFSRETAPETVKIDTISKEALKGQKLTITLMDGTIIKLNAESAISYPNQFFEDKREVYLNGEAFFNVASNPEMPFVVHTGNITTTVLGTAFNIGAYQEMDQIKVAVLEGKVRVSSNKDSVTDQQVDLVNKQMAMLTKGIDEISVSQFDYDKEFGWKDGILNFEKAEFNEIVTKLERWYGVDFEVDYQKQINQKWRFSGKFENKSLEYVLDVLRYPELFSFKIDDKNVIIN